MSISTLSIRPQGLDWGRAVRYNPHNVSMPITPHLPCPLSWPLARVFSPLGLQGQMLPVCCPNSSALDCRHHFSMRTWLNCIPFLVGSSRLLFQPSPLRCHLLEKHNQSVIMSPQMSAVHCITQWGYASTLSSGSLGEDAGHQAKPDLSATKWYSKRTNFCKLLLSAHCGTHIHNHTHTYTYSHSQSELYSNSVPPPHSLILWYTGSEEATQTLEPTS